MSNLTCIREPTAPLEHGRSKAEARNRVLHRSRHPDELPAQLMRPRRGRLIWMADEAAARFPAQVAVN